MKKIWLFLIFMLLVGCSNSESTYELTQQNTDALKTLTFDIVTDALSLGDDYRENIVKEEGALGAGNPYTIYFKKDKKAYSLSNGKTVDITMLDTSKFFGESQVAYRGIEDTSKDFGAETYLEDGNAVDILTEYGTIYFEKTAGIEMTTNQLFDFGDDGSFEGSGVLKYSLPASDNEYVTVEDINCKEPADGDHVIVLSNAETGDKVKASIETSSGYAQIIYPSFDSGNENNLLKFCL